MEVHILINRDVDCCGEDHVNVFVTKTELINFYVEYTSEHYPEQYQFLIDKFTDSSDKLESEMFKALLGKSYDESKVDVSSLLQWHDEGWYYLTKTM